LWGPRNSKTEKLRKLKNWGEKRAEGKYYLGEVKRVMYEARLFKGL